MNNIFTSYQRPLQCACLVIALIFSVSDAAAESKSEYQAKMRETDQQLAQLKSELASTRDQRSQLLTKLQQTDQQLGTKEARIQELKTGIQEYEKQVDQLDSRLSNLHQHVALSQQRLARMIRRSQQARANNGLQVMLQHTDAAQANRLGVYYDYYFRAQHQVIKHTQAKLELIVDAQTEAKKSRNWLLHLKKKATKNKQKITRRESAERTSLAALDSSLAQQQKSLAELKEEQTKLAELIESLRENALGASGFFASGKGKYPYPVTGSLATRFGSTKALGKLKWTGITIEASVGKPVRTIADGEVVYADWLQGFGMLVIVDHGDGYMTLYGGNRDLTVTQGQWVEFGATIATVGQSAGHKLSGVYFEIRHNAKPINPEAWIGAKNRFETTNMSGN